MADMNPPVDDIFAGMKKKRKGAKKINLDELDLDAPSPSAPSSDAAGNTAATDLAAAPTPADAGDDADLDFADLKKRRKKKTVRIDSDPEDAPEDAGSKSSKRVDKLGNEIDDEPVEAQAAAGDAAADAGGLDEFADLKKKRKKSSKKAFDLEAFEKELAESESAQASDAPAEPKGILKKKRTPLGSDDEGEGEDDEPVEGEDPFAKEDQEEDEGQLSKAEAAAQAKAWLKEDRDYTYTELLGRFFSLLYQSHPSLSGGTNKKKYTIPPPQLFREGNKRSIFANIADICKRMHRQPEHVIQFLFAELGTNGSVDGSARLVIKGRFQQKQIENVLRRYIVEYVTCKTCKSPDTTMTKDNRLFFMTARRAARA
ncbi:translation initiation factor eIF-2 beta subunit [Rhodotorula kratochvilovae]